MLSNKREYPPLGVLVTWLTCTDVELTLHHPHAELPPHIRALTTPWLTAHGLQPNRLVPHRPITRDAYLGRLSWFETDAAGEVRQRLHYYSPQTQPWPAVFPAGLTTPAP